MSKLPYHSPQCQWPTRPSWTLVAVVLCPKGLVVTKIRLRRKGHTFQQN